MRYKVLSNVNTCKVCVLPLMCGWCSTSICTELNSRINYNNDNWQINRTIKTNIIINFYKNSGYLLTVETKEYAYVDVLGSRKSPICSLPTPLCVTVVSKGVSGWLEKLSYVIKVSSHPTLIRNRCYA